MKIGDYYEQVYLPGNRAVSDLRTAGIPVDIERVKMQALAWEAEIKRHERVVEEAAAARGIALKYSATHSCNEGALVALLFGPKGICGEAEVMTEGGSRPSTAEEAVSKFASLPNHREDDHPVVYSMLKVRSLSRGTSTYLRAFANTRRADGCCHPKFNFAVVRTARLSAEDPPVHQIPEHSERPCKNEGCSCKWGNDIAFGVKSIFVPRLTPARNAEEWDPRKHGSFFRWDIAGAEAAIRAAMLTYLFCSKPSKLWEYIRLGKDVHARNASLIYGGDDQTWPKGTYQRDKVGKQTFFLKIFGGEGGAIRQTVWREARIELSEEEAERISTAFDEGDPELVELYHLDGDKLGRLGYAEDGYGRRRWVGVPDGIVYGGLVNGRCRWGFKSLVKSRRRHLERQLKRAWHITANTPTQSMNASDTLWMLALAAYGEYVPLRLPPMWERRGLFFPEAAGWQMHEGPGPGGKPFKSWHNNTVHDSGWGDCGPGMLEATAKLLWRRCTAVPFDWRLKSDVPYRIELKVGPDGATMYDYNKVAKRFGLEPLPEL